MLKRMFALSDQGSRDLNKGIAATTLSNLCLIAPVSLLVMVIWELLNVISGQESSMQDHAALCICGTVVMFIIVFLTQWLQYNKTYTVAYEESANRRIVLAEKLRKLPLSFFGQRDLSDLTTTIMGDCTALERVFSNAIPQLFGTIFMFIITAIGLLVLDWRVGLCIVVPVPVAALVVFAAKKAQSNAESANMDAKRAAYDGVQEYLDTIQELKSCSREEEYLEGLEKKLDYVVKCSFRNEIAPGAATTTAQFILRFGLVAVMLVGGILVTAGSLSIPMFILFLLFAGRIYDPFTSCFMLMAEVFSALVSVKRMKQIDATPEQTGTNVCNNKVKSTPYFLAQGLNAPMFASVTSMLVRAAPWAFSCFRLCLPWCSFGPLARCCKYFFRAACNAWAVSLPVFMDRAIVFWVTSSCNMNPSLLQKIQSGS